MSLAVALGAGADVYRYETEEGTVSYTDDEQRVPARYRESVERVPLRRLNDYKRFTPSQTRRRDSWESGREAPISATRPIEQTHPTAPDVRPGIRVDVPAGWTPAPTPITVRREWRWERNVNGWNGQTFGLFEVTRDAEGHILRDELISSGLPRRR